MMNPVAMSIITNTFTDPRERAQAVGVWGAVFGVSMALGPIVGGTLVSVGRLAVDLPDQPPVGLAAIALTLRFVPESRAPRPRRFDPVGQVLVIVLLAALTFGIIEAPSRGWTSPIILAAFAAAGAALVGLLVYEPRRDEPLIDLRFFRSIPFASSIVISVAAFAAFGGLPLPEHPVPPAGARALAGAGRARHRADGADDGGRVRRCPAASSAAAGPACRS